MKRLWAPWRIRYITDQVRDNEPEGCFLCRAVEEGIGGDSLVIYQGDSALIVMNRYPYCSGHLMVAPAVHQGEIDEIAEEVAGEMWKLTCLAKRVLQEQLTPDGFNIGINQGRCGGAGVTDHLHWHVVPRWNGDHNFMPVLADTTVLPQALEELCEILVPAFAEAAAPQ
ncbi:MAG: HIT family protein [Planctomycetota bacterium]